jgi:glycosyltransferase involved in cell wall biosynthesis
LKKSEALFIAWVTWSRRPVGLSEWFGLEPIFIDLFPKRGLFWNLFFPIDYLMKSLSTLAELLKHRPRIVFAQSGPSFCPMTVSFYRLFFKCRMVVDCHNSAFEKPWIQVPFYLRILRNANLVLVHNDEWFDYLQKQYPDVPLFCLPDPIPEFPEDQNTGSHVLISMSYSADEPIREVLEGIRIYRHRGGKLEFKITGNWRKMEKLCLPFHEVDGLEFTGFVSNERYQEFLLTAAGVGAFSVRDMVQQCATVEAVGAGIPIVTSDSSTSRRLFPQGAVLTLNEPEPIADAFCKLEANQGKLKMEIFKLASSLKKDWIQRAETVRRRIWGN